MTKEQVIESPVYVVEEEDDEEETFTLDFDNKTAYQMEEHLIINEGPVLPYGETISATIAPAPAPEPTFKNEMQDLLLNTITSKAIGSLMKKRLELDTDIDNLLEKQKMGDLSNILSTEIGEILYNRKLELRQCYVGSEVRYERIPDWAKSYIKEYTKDMIHGLTVLIDE